MKWLDAKSLAGPLSNRLLNLTNNEIGPFKAAVIGQQAQFLLTREGKPEFAVINGYAIDLNKDLQQVPNVFGY